MFFDFVNDGRHVTLSATEVPCQNILGDFELNMSGLQEFDLVATPIHEYYGPSIGSTVLTPVAPPRALGSWARPSDAEYTEGRQIARRLAARGASSAVPQPLMEEASRASMSLVPAWQSSLESRREGPTAEALPEPEALREARQDLGSAPIGATDPFATAEDVTLSHELALLPRYAWQTSLQSPPSVREAARGQPRSPNH